MKVYFTASTSQNGEFLSFYKQILHLLKQHHLTIISGTQIVNKELLKKDKVLTARQIFNREKSLIDKADFIIAEVTKPSLGVGGEIVYALTKNKPVLALLQVDYEDKISPMIAGNPSENIFIEIYRENNIRFIISDFVSHMKSIKKRKGKLIVVDGGDGSGKTTQAQLLINYLKKKKIPTKYIDFPQYYQSFHGKVVAKFLRGEFGKIDEVSPYLASLAYALDRASVKKEMEEFLKRGGYIIANRYATSNMAHQAAKFKSEKEKKEYLKWEYELEYKVHKIPREDLVIYLYVPWKTGINLTKKKGERKYLEGVKHDIAEKDLNHRIESEKMYLELAKKYKHWVTIDCVVNGTLLSRDKIHKKVVEVIEKNDILYV